MYAYQLKLGPRSFTNDTVIYFGITFEHGLSTKPVSEQEIERFTGCGFDVEKVPVTSPEHDDLRKEIEQLKVNHEARLLEVAGKYIATINKQDHDITVLMQERDEARKQLSLNLELMELRNDKNTPVSRGGSVPPSKR